MGVQPPQKEAFLGGREKFEHAFRPPDPEIHSQETLWVPGRPQEHSQKTSPRPAELWVWGLRYLLDKATSTGCKENRLPYRDLCATSRK